MALAADAGELLAHPGQVVGRAPAVVVVVIIPRFHVVAGHPLGAVACLLTQHGWLWQPMADALWVVNWLNSTGLPS